MKPLSGMWLYINLAFAIFWDFLGLILFVIGLIPAIQFIAVAISPLLDVIAFITDLIFTFLYYSYVQLYKVNFIRYQISRVKEMMRLSRRNRGSGNSSNPISNALANNTKKISQYMANTFTDYVVNFAISRIRNSIMVATIELVPWLGDFSPSWTIKAWMHIREHRKIARRLKAKNIEFENSLAKWRGSLRLNSRNSIRPFTMQTQQKSTPDNKISSNNIRSLRRSNPNLATNNIRSVNRPGIKSTVK